MSVLDRCGDEHTEIRTASENVMKRYLCIPNNHQVLPVQCDINCHWICMPAAGRCITDYLTPSTIAVKSCLYQQQCSAVFISIRDNCSSKKQCHHVVVPSRTKWRYVPDQRRRQAQLQLAGAASVCVWLLPVIISARRTAVCKVTSLLLWQPLPPRATPQPTKLQCCFVLHGVSAVMHGPPGPRAWHPCKAFLLSLKYQKSCCLIFSLSIQLAWHASCVWIFHQLFSYWQSGAVLPIS